MHIHLPLLMALSLLSLKQELAKNKIDIEKYVNSLVCIFIVSPIERDCVSFEPCAKSMTWHPQHKSRRKIVVYTPHRAKLHLVCLHLFDVYMKEMNTKDCHIRLQARQSWWHGLRCAKPAAWGLFYSTLTIVLLALSSCLFVQRVNTPANNDIVVDLMDTCYKINNVQLQYDALIPIKKLEEIFGPISHVKNNNGFSTYKSKKYNIEFLSSEEGLIENYAFFFPGEFCSRPYNKNSGNIRLYFLGREISNRQKYEDLTSDALFSRYIRSTIPNSSISLAHSKFMLTIMYIDSEEICSVYFDI